MGKDKKPESEEMTHPDPEASPDVIEEPGPELEPETEPDNDVMELDEDSEIDNGDDTGSTSFSGDMSPEEAIGSLKARVNQLEAENRGLKETLLRKMAEFENLKKRTEREKEEAVRYGTASVLGGLLDVLDNFDRALAAEPELSDHHSFYEGMKLIARHLKEILRGEGLSEISPEGEPFDPFYHEAMMREETDEVPDNTVLEVFQKGYKLRDRLLRPARVKVGTRPSEPVTDEAEDEAPVTSEENES